MKTNEEKGFALLAARQNALGASITPDLLQSPLLDEIRKDLAPEVPPGPRGDTLGQKKLPLSRLQRVGLSMVALFVGLALSAATALIDAPQPLILTAAAFSLSAAGLMLAGAIPGAARLDQPARRVVLALLILTTFTALALHAEDFLSWTEFIQGDGGVHAATCAGHSLATGVMASSALMFLWRRTDPFSPGLTGAILGFIGGALGTLSVGFLCDHGSEGIHLTMSHGLSALLLAGLGYWAGQKWLSP